MKFIPQFYARQFRLPLIVGATALATVLFAGTTTQAASIFKYESYGTPREVPDDGYVGTMAGDTVAKGRFHFDPEDGQYITDVNVSVYMSHEHIGDLSIKLRSPSGTVATLLDRPGRTGGSNGADGGGDSSNFAVNQRIAFDDEVPHGSPSENMGSFTYSGADLGDNDAVGVGPDTPGRVVSSSSSSNINTLKLFNGELLAGKWVIAIGDSTPDNFAPGQFKAWSMEVTTSAEAPAQPTGQTQESQVSSAPAPSAALSGLMLLGGLFGIGAIRRPTRRQA